MIYYFFYLRLLISLLFYTAVTAAPTGQSRPSFDSLRAFSYLEKQVAFGPRNPGSPGHKQCKDFLVGELKKFHGLVEEQSFIHYDTFREISMTMTNIIARFSQGVEPRILLCAHWDTRPFADQDKNPANRTKPILGANDGASGVAVLLEIARQISEHPPKAGVDIVLFDGEDYGREGHLDEYFVGSRYFAENNSDIYPLFGILIDMVGDAELRLPIEGYSNEFAPEVVEKVWNTAAVLGYSQFVDQVETYISDDHIILNSAGIPTIDIIDMNYPNERENYWHTLEDTPDKCSPASLKAVGEVLLEVIYREGN